MKVNPRGLAEDGWEEALAGLARQVDQLRQELATVAGSGARVREDVESHNRTLSDLSDLLRRVTSTGRPAEPDDEAEPGVPEWMTVTDAGLAVAWLTGLTAWVRDVYARYSPLPACWPWHPHAVAELLACHGVWTSAVLPDAAPEAIAGWHDRWRPGTERRLDDVLAGCQRARGLHVEGASRFDVDPAYLDEYAEHWATTHDPAATGAPGLTLNLQDRR